MEREEIKEWEKTSVLTQLKSDFSCDTTTNPVLSSWLLLTSASFSFPFSWILCKMGVMLASAARDGGHGVRKMASAS